MRLFKSKEVIELDKHTNVIQSDCNNALTGIVQGKKTKEKHKKFFCKSLIFVHFDFVAPAIDILLCPVYENPHLGSLLHKDFASNNEDEAYVKLWLESAEEFVLNVSFIAFF